MNLFLTIIAALCLGFCFPFAYEGTLFPDLGWLAYFAYLPLFLILVRKSFKKSLRFIFTAHTLGFAISMYWILVALIEYGGIPLSLSLAMYFALVAILGAYLTLPFYLALRLSRVLKISFWFLIPFTYVAIEFLRNMAPFGGFPWNQVAYSQSKFLLILQSLDLMGPYFLTFLILFVNVALFQLYLYFSSVIPGIKLSLIPLTVLLFTLTCLYGHWRLQHLEKFTAVSELKVAIVQPNISQDEKWLSGKEEKVIKILADLNQAAEKLGAELILWPEAAFPYIIAHDIGELRFDLGLKKADVFAGAVTLSLEEYMKDKVIRSNNSAMIIGSQGEIKSVYHKVHLVPFGEYIPLKQIFFFIDKIVDVEGELLPGKAAHPISYRSWLFAPLICFEDLFPEISRTMVKGGAHALFNLTNDGWYNQSSAALQHLVFSQYRAIETRRDLLRATNTGISAHIGHTGRVLWTRPWFVSDIHLTHLKLRNGESIYVKVGDLFAWLVLLAVGFLYLTSFFKKEKSS